MERQIYTHPKLVFSRIVDRLQASIDGAGEANCYLTLDPDSLPAVPSEFNYTVSPAPSAAFSQAHFSGGGQYQATLDWIVVVTIHGTNQSDEEGRDTSFLTHRSRGIIEKWMEVVQCLAGYELKEDDTEDAAAILNQPLFPVDIAVERRTRRNGSMQFAVHCQFDVDALG